MSDKIKSIPSVSVTYARNGTSTKANALGMRPMQERVFERRGEQYLLIKSPPASGKSRALMFVALDKLKNQGLKQAIIVVPEKSIGASFNDELLTDFGFWADWRVEPKWNLCNAPGDENGGKVKSLAAFLKTDDKILVCTHATFRFAVEECGVEAFDDRLIAIDEFHHVSASGQLSFGGELEADDVESGTIYVLRSLSDHPYVAQHRDLIHKIGVTGSKVEVRIAGAEHDATYLLAKVEVVATYKLAGINRARMESLFHKLFATAQLDITINDRFGHPVQPQEWFLVPVFVIDEAVERIKDGTITSYVYDPKKARLVKV